MKLFFTTLFCLGLLTACQAAPPFISPNGHPTTLAWNPSIGADGYNVKFYDTTNQVWDLALIVPAPQTNAPGILTNWPQGTAFCVTAYNSTMESDGSNIVTNNVVQAPNSVKIK